MRRSISGKKVQTLRDRSSLFTKEIDTNLIREWKKETSFGGQGSLRQEYGTISSEQYRKNYMDLK